MPLSASDFFGDELCDIKHEVEQIVADSGRWLKTPHDQLGGRKPLDLIGIKDEQQLRDLIRAIKHGMPV
ncbi:MAG TPA: MbcA/ParS/Xre antitoxin family protein [Candidatus Tectomicrobia bacterium]|jgi:hypothetical protein